jgi:hypothetical protein
VRCSCSFFYHVHDPALVKIASLNDCEIFPMVLHESMWYSVAGHICTSQGKMPSKGCFDDHISCPQNLPVGLCCHRRLAWGPWEATSTCKIAIQTEYACFFGYCRLLPWISCLFSTLERHGNGVCSTAPSTRQIVREEPNQYCGPVGRERLDNRRELFAGSLSDRFS